MPRVRTEGQASFVLEWNEGSMEDSCCAEIRETLEVWGKVVAFGIDYGSHQGKMC